MPSDRSRVLPDEEITTFGGGGNGTVAVSSAVPGAGGLTVNQTGDGVVALTGANTYTGATTVNAGTLAASTAVTVDPSSYTLTSSAFGSFTDVTLSSAGGALSPSFTTVPEPGAVFGVAAGVLGLAALARRIRRRTA